MSAGGDSSALGMGGNREMVEEVHKVEEELRRRYVLASFNPETHPHYVESLLTLLMQITHWVHIFTRHSPARIRRAEGV